MEPTAPSGGETLKAWRKLRKHSLKDVGDGVGVSAPAVLDWETGRRTPTFENALRLDQFSEGGIPVSVWGEEFARTLAALRETDRVNTTRENDDADPPATDSDHGGA